jgi:hypothetical protein
MRRKLEITMYFLVIVLILSTIGPYEAVNANLVTYSFTINHGGSLDVDTGTAGTSSSMDILNSGTPASLLTQNGAVMALTDSEDLYLIRTSLGNYAKLRVDEVNAPIVTFTVLYQDDGGTGLCGTNPVSGYVMSVNRSKVLAPYLALLGIIATVSTIYVIKRRKD